MHSPVCWRTTPCRCVHVVHEIVILHCMASDYDTCSSRVALRILSLWHDGSSRSCASSKTRPGPCFSRRFMPHETSCAGCARLAPGARPQRSSGNTVQPSRSAPVFTLHSNCSQRTLAQQMRPWCGKLLHATARPSCPAGCTSQHRCSSRGVVTSIL